MLVRTPEQLRCGTKIQTANGWYPIVRIWLMVGKVYKVDLVVANKEQTYDAEELCKHIIDWEPI